MGIKMKWQELQRCLEINSWLMSHKSIDMS